MSLIVTLQKFRPIIYLFTMILTFVAFSIILLPSGNRAFLSKRPNGKCTPQIVAESFIFKAALYVGIWLKSLWWFRLMVEGKIRLQSKSLQWFGNETIIRVDEIMTKYTTKDGAENDIKIYQPKKMNDRMIIYVHGGGFSFGSLRMYDDFCHRLANYSGSTVFSVEYRQAPEYRYPTAFNDVRDAVIYIYEHASEWNVNRELMAIAGDSAGGNIAAGIVMLRRDKPELFPKGFDIRFQAMIYPLMTYYPEPRGMESRMKYGEQGLILDDELTTMLMDLYVPEELREEAAKDPYLNIIKENAVFSSLPDAFFYLVAHDLLRDEGAYYAKGLKLGGSEVSLHVEIGYVHGDVINSNLTDSAANMIADKISQHFDKNIYV